MYALFLICLSIFSVIVNNPLDDICKYIVYHIWLENLALFYFGNLANKKKIANLNTAQNRNIVQSYLIANLKTNYFCLHHAVASYKMISVERKGENKHYAVQRHDNYVTLYTYRCPTEQF